MSQPRTLTPLAIVFPAWTAATSSGHLLKEMQVTMSLLARCSRFTALALIAVTAVASAQTPAFTSAPWSSNHFATRSLPWPAARCSKSTRRG